MPGDPPAGTAGLEAATWLQVAGVRVGDEIPAAEGSLGHAVIGDAGLPTGDQDGQRRRKPAWVSQAAIHSRPSRLVLSCGEELGHRVPQLAQRRIHGAADNLGVHPVVMMGQQIPQPGDL
jgi:hypothetical protein